MIIAIAIYNRNISNVFDFAQRLLLVEVEEGQEKDRREVELDSKLFMQRVGQLQRLEVDVLVCGAISRVLAEMVTSAGIQVLPYVTGNIDDILTAYLAGQLVESRYAMPGCWPGARNGFGRGGRSGGRGCQWRGGRR